jgi:uncharacterized protein YgbK (DUF1537 family)
MTRLVIVADDLTGACDSAALLHTRGTTSVVLDAAGPWPDVPVLSVDTDSRHCEERLATGRVAAVTDRALGLHAELVKKIDSTLRGRLGGVNEVVAVLLLAAHRGVPVCPHAGGVGLCELVQHISAFDFVAVSGSIDEHRFPDGACWRGSAAGSTGAP